VRGKKEEFPIQNWGGGVTLGKGGCRREVRPRRYHSIWMGEEKKEIEKGGMPCARDGKGIRLERKERWTNPYQREPLGDIFKGGRARKGAHEKRIAPRGRTSFFSKSNKTMLRMHVIIGNIIKLNGRRQGRKERGYISPKKKNVEKIVGGGGNPRKGLAFLAGLQSLESDHSRGHHFFGGMEQRQVFREQRGAGKSPNRERGNSKKGRRNTEKKLLWGERSARENYPPLNR